MCRPSLGKDYGFWFSSLSISYNPEYLCCSSSCYTYCLCAILIKQMKYTQLAFLHQVSDCAILRVGSNAKNLTSSSCDVRPMTDTAITAYRRTKGVWCATWKVWLYNAILCQAMHIFHMFSADLNFVQSFSILYLTVPQ